MKLTLLWSENFGIVSVRVRVVKLHTGDITVKLVTVFTTL